VIIEYANLIGLACIPGFLLLDLVVRNRKFQTTRFWRLRGLLMTAFIFWFTGQVGLLWGKLLGNFHLFDGAGLGILGGTLVGILVYELFHYWYHRIMHRTPALWRRIHQMHHSTESLDAFGANWIHPVDAMMFASIASLVFFPLLGLRPEAGAIGAAFLTFNAMFQHANIKTPRWLGYVIQRPESHSYHHLRHRHNYADLPLWDMVFGTFVNPAKMEPRTGFYMGASTRVVDMLLGRDVSRPKTTRKVEAKEKVAA